MSACNRLELYIIVKDRTPRLLLDTASAGFFLGARPRTSVLGRMIGLIVLLAHKLLPPASLDHLR